MRQRPLDCRPERSPFHDHDAARVNPLDGARAAAALGKPRWTSISSAIAPSTYRSVRTPQTHDLAAKTLILLFGKSDEAEQCIRHTFAGRQHDRLSAGGLRLDQARDTHEAVGVGDA